MKTLEEIKIETAKEMNYPQRVDLYIDEVAKRFAYQTLAEYKAKLKIKLSALSVLDSESDDYILLMEAERAIDTLADG